MANPITPNDSRIYIELNGVIMAEIQSIDSTTRRDLTPSYSFGRTESTGMKKGPRTHELRISRIYITEDGLTNNLTLDQLEDFTIVENFPDHKNVYENCNWAEISRTMTNNEQIAENVTIMAVRKRKENK